MDLNPEQDRAANCGGDVTVTACPGSGKTRVLTARVIRGVRELRSVRERVIALTFTNRAADEIRNRLDRESVPKASLWAGTIHAFALEWILRPYAPYLETIRRGFSVADEYYCERLLRDIKREVGLGQYEVINTVHGRDGTVENPAGRHQHAFQLYKDELRRVKLIDYDEVLYFAYRLVADNAEIAANLNAIFRLFCLDEVQDIQDLQYGIISAIYCAADPTPQLFLVGDVNQSIYDSLGATSKSYYEIAAEFGMDDLNHHELVGNYRSTQRIIDLCQVIRPSVGHIESRVAHPEERGSIAFCDQIIAKEELPDRIGDLIKLALDAGVPEQEICVVAPQWNHLKSVSRGLIERLPEVNFDAPGISPLYSVRDNPWYKLARLVLTEPVPMQMRSRARFAKEFLTDLDGLICSALPQELASPRRLLRLTNRLQSTEVEGVPYLRDLFVQFLSWCDISLDAHEALKQSFESFFDKAESQLADPTGGVPSSVDDFKKIFHYPSGVVMSTCHGVKGEEFDTVIAFGLLRGYVPNWSVIINGSNWEADESESKLLYVVASRAKRQLYLIAESGRQTQRGAPYQTSPLLAAVEFDYD